MKLLILFAAITAYAIGITMFYVEQCDDMRISQCKLNTEREISQGWRMRLFRVMNENREKQNKLYDEINKLERENRRLKDSNSRMMERMKRVMP